MISLTPGKFIKASGILFKYLPLVFIFMLLLSANLIMKSPDDYQQADYVKIMYVHVPSAWLSLALYALCAFLSLLSILFGSTIFYIFSASLAPVGLVFSLITLVTGSIWGYPMWGTWWVWDARLTSMLILFLFYLSYISLVNAGDDIFRAQKPASVLCLIGFINIPIVKFSVDIWNSLHQPASVIRFSGPAIDFEMLKPLFSMFISFFVLSLMIFLLRASTILIDCKSRRMK